MHGSWFFRCKKEKKLIPTKEFEIPRTQAVSKVCLAWPRVSFQFRPYGSPLPGATSKSAVATSKSANQALFHGIHFLLLQKAGRDDLRVAIEKEGGQVLFPNEYQAAREDMQQSNASESRKERRTSDYSAMSHAKKPPLLISYAVWPVNLLLR